MKEIILLHGALGDTKQLERLSALLTEKGFKIFLFNFSGHGRRPFSTEFSVPQFASELKSFIIEKQLMAPNVFGYSMGGYVATYLALQDSEILGKVITLGTKFKWTKAIAEKEVLKLNPDTIDKKVHRFAAVLQERHGLEWKELVRKTAELIVKLGEDNLLPVTAFKKIKTKALIGIGDKDDMVTLGETRSAFNKLPHAGMFMLPFTRHQIETVNVVMLADVINDFVEASDKFAAQAETEKQ
jgi:pimeloyl-ACP methyl ester carboxylesterase